MELQPQHRRSRQPARGRDGQHVGERARNRIALEPALKARNEHEDRGDGGEGELETRVEEVVGVPREQGQRSDQQEVPPVLRPRREPRQRDERAGDSCTDDRRLRSNRKHVPADRKQRRELTEPARNPEQPRNCERAAGDQDNVLPRHGQEVVEARAPKALPQLLGEALLVAEYDALDHAPPFAVQSGSNRAGQDPAKPVGDSAETAAMTDELPPVGAEDDMDAVAPQPSALVEAAFRRLRRPHRGDSVEQATLWRRAAERQLEQDSLPETEPPEAANLGWDSQLEPRSPRRAGHLEHRAFGSVHPGEQDAVIERIQPSASPPPPG